jgi:hypothetical protein
MDVLVGSKQPAMLIVTPKYRLGRTNFCQTAEKPIIRQISWIGEIDIEAGLSDR